MSSRSSRAAPRSVARQAVLCLGSDSAEWYEPGPESGSGYARVPVEGPGPDALVRAAVAARKAAGGRTRQCVLVLSHGLLSQRLLKLPVLPQRELARVVHRKAAGLIDSDERQTFFATLHVEGDEEAQEAPGWLVVAMRRPDIQRLRLGLRRERLAVKRVVSLELAPLAIAWGAGEEERATIAVCVNERACGVSLLAEGRLVAHERIEGDLEQSPSLAASLVQTVRSTASYWRRVRRGEVVQRVVVLGLEPERAEVLTRALATSVPEAEVHYEPAPTGEAPGAHAGRACLLSSALLKSPFDLDLTSRLPARKSLLVAAGAVLVGLVLSLGLMLRHSTLRELGEVQARVERLVREQGGLAFDEADNQLARSELAELRARLARAQALGAWGIPYERVVGHALASLGEDAALLSLSVGPEVEGQRDYQVRAETWPEPVHATAAISSVRQRMERAPELSELYVDLASNVAANAPAAGAAAGVSWTAFSVSGLLEQAQPPLAPPPDELGGEEDEDA